MRNTFDWRQREEALLNILSRYISACQADAAAEQWAAEVAKRPELSEPHQQDHDAA